MELKQLHYFVTVIQEGTISAAARKLNLTQPPLSAQMKLLEQEVGCPLFERGSRRIQLTEAGRMLYNRAVTMLEYADITRQELADYLKGTSGTLRLGVVSSVGSTHLVRIVRDFHEIHPQIAFELMEANTYQLLEQLKASLLELAIVRTPFSDQGFTSCRILEEPMLAVGNRRFFEAVPDSSDGQSPFEMPHDAAVLSGAAATPDAAVLSGAAAPYGVTVSSGTAATPDTPVLSGAPTPAFTAAGIGGAYPLLPLTALSGKPLIIYRRWEEVLFRRFQNAHITPKVFCKNDDARTSALWADAGLGVAILPASTAGLIHNPQTLIYEIDDPGLSSGICVISNKDAWLSAIAKTFLHYLNSSFRESSERIS